jgi:hypothetical protein
VEEEELCGWALAWLLLLVAFGGLVLGGDVLLGVCVVIDLSVVRRREWRFFVDILNKVVIVLWSIVELLMSCWILL